MRSIIQDDENCCYICGSMRWLEEHHIFGGSCRKFSTQYGLTVRLCHFCHNEPPDGVHYSKERMTWLKQIGQRAFEKNHTHEEYMEIFDKNYL